MRRSIFGVLQKMTQRRRFNFSPEIPFRKGGDEGRRFLTKVDLRGNMYSISMLKTKAYKYRLYPPKKTNIDVRSNP